MFTENFVNYQIIDYNEISEPGIQCLPKLEFKASNIGITIEDNPFKPTEEHCRPKMDQKYQDILLEAHPKVIKLPHFQIVEQNSSNTQTPNKDCDVRNVNVTNPPTIRIISQPLFIDPQKSQKRISGFRTIAPRPVCDQPTNQIKIGGNVYKIVNFQKYTSRSLPKHTIEIPNTGGTLKVIDQNNSNSTGSLDKSIPKIITTTPGNDLGLGVSQNSTSNMNKTVPRILKRSRYKLQEIQTPMPLVKLLPTVQQKPKKLSRYEMLMRTINKQQVEYEKLFNFDPELKKKFGIQDAPNNESDDAIIVNDQECQNSTPNPKLTKKKTKKRKKIRSNKSQTIPTTIDISDNKNEVQETLEESEHELQDEMEEDEEDDRKKLKDDPDFNVSEQDVPSSDESYSADEENFGLTLEQIDEKEELFEAQIEKVYKDYIINHANTNETTKCNQCNRSFDTFIDLGMHSILHNKNNWFVCPICEVSADSETVFRQHAQKHNRYECFRCKTFVTQEYAHVKKHVYLEQMIKCSMCAKKLPRCQLKQHDLTEHKGEERQYKCTVCPKEYNDRRQLKEHYGFFHKEFGLDTSAICEFCGLGFLRKSSLKIHMRKHTNDRRYTCSQCPQKFYTSSGLSKHMAKHTGDKNFSCTICGKKYRYHSTLDYHKKLHTGQKCKCPICGRPFVSTSNMKVHMKICKGEYEPDHE